MSEGSTGLTVYSRNDFLSIAENSDLAEALRANMQEGDTFSESSLIRVKTPAAGVLKWTINGISGPEEVVEIEGALVFQCRRGVLWKSLDPSPGMKPVLSTSDMKFARKVAEDRDVPQAMLDEINKHIVQPATATSPAIYDWNALPYTQFGSGKNGHGKFAKEQRSLFILRRNDAWPLLVNCQPGSLKAISNFIMQLPVPHWRAVVGLGLKTSTSDAGIAYSEIVPRLKGILNKEEGDIIKSQYTDRLKESWDSGKLSVDEG